MYTILKSDVLRVFPKNKVKVLSWNHLFLHFIDIPESPGNLWNILLLFTSNIIPIAN